MPIRVNLLPDVRLAKMRDQRTRQMVFGISILVWSVSGLGVLGLFIAYSAQNFQLAQLNKTIASDLVAIAAVNDLNTALSAQQATKALSNLYQQNTKYSNFVPNLASRTPKDVSLSTVTADTAGTLTVAGVAKNALTLDTFIKALQTPVTGKTNAYFSNIVISTVTKDISGKATFSFTATINPEAMYGKE